MKISIISLFKNNEKYLLFFCKKIYEIEKKYKNISFEYFLYENDSTDHTLEVLKMFMKNRKGKLFSEKNKTTNIYDKEISINRGIFMKNLRNNLKQLHGKLDSDFVILIDADTIFLEDIIYNLISHFKSFPHVSMVTPYCLDWKTIMEGFYNHYYDTLALITDNNISYLETNNSCLFENCNFCPYIRSISQRNNKDPLQNMKIKLNGDKYIKVKTAFGCFGGIRTEIYNEIEWGNSVCEHHSFCKKIRKYGDIHLIFNTFIMNCHIKKYSNLKSFQDIEKYLKKYIKHKNI